MIYSVHYSIYQPVFYRTLFCTKPDFSTGSFVHNSFHSLIFLFLKILSPIKDALLSLHNPKQSHLHNILPAVHVSDHHLHKYL